MAFKKRISVAFPSFLTSNELQDTYTGGSLGTGKTVYAIVRRESNKSILDDVDGVFRGTAVDNFIALVEDVLIKGFYEKEESRTVWTDGAYSFYFYDQIGGGPVPADDSLIGLRLVSIFRDQISLESDPLIRLRKQEGELRNILQQTRLNRSLIVNGIDNLERSFENQAETANRPTLDGVVSRKIGDR